MSKKNWFDSWPGIEVDDSWVVLDNYGTPFGGPEAGPADPATFHGQASSHAPYTTTDQNRGGVA
jgi:hypothetical protein